VPRRRRAQSATEVFADDAGFLSLAPDGGFKVYEQRPAIKECPLADEHRYKRDEDFIDELQLFLNGGITPPCSEIFDALCAAFGAGAPPVDIPTADCCALSSLPHSWTFSNPLLFQCQCGSGYRKGSEQCDDGELVGGGEPGDNDGCNKFCEVERGVPCRSSASFTCLRRTSRTNTRGASQVETYFGWSCTQFPDSPDGSPAPDQCFCSCDCEQKCTCASPRSLQPRCPPAARLSSPPPARPQVPGRGAARLLQRRRLRQQGRQARPPSLPY